MTRGWGGGDGGKEVGDAPNDRSVEVVLTVALFGQHILTGSGFFT